MPIYMSRGKVRDKYKYKYIQDKVGYFFISV